MVITLVEEERLSFQFDTGSESHVISFWALPHHMSALCNVWWPYVSWRKKYFIFSLSRNITWPRGLSDFWLTGCLYVTISHQLAKCCGHRPCQRRYITLLICPVNTHDHLDRESWDPIGGFLSPYVTNLTCLVAIGFVK